MFRLYQFEISPFCDKIRRALRYKGIAFEVENIPVTSAITAIKKMNPAGKLPCLDMDGRLVSDSTEIAEALEDLVPSPSLYPGDLKEQALIHVLEDWADESLYYYEMALRFGMRHNARRWIPELLKHDPPLLARAAGAFVPIAIRRQLASQGLGKKGDARVIDDVSRHVRAIEGLLGEGEWLVGSALSIADLSVYAQIFCIRGADEGARLIDARPHVIAWMRRVEEATS